MVTNKQKQDIETIKFFIPSWVKFDEPSDIDVNLFLELSEKGLHKGLIDCRKRDGFNALAQGKRWRGIHIHEMWEEGVFDKSMPYAVIFEDMPTSVIRFAAREMFEGIDKERILGHCL